MIELIEGDFFEVVDEIPESVDVVFTDPPYNISEGGDTSFPNNYVTHFGEWDEDDSLPELWVPLLEEIVEPRSLISFYDNRQMHDLIPILEQCEYEIVQKGYWYKPNPAPRWRAQDRWMGAVEEFVVSAREDWWFNSEVKQDTNVFHGAPPRGDERIHPTQKPVSVVERIMSYWVQPDDVVLDPFMGSGTTGVAARKIGADFVGIERDADYFESAQTRITDDVKSVFDW